MSEFTQFDLDELVAGTLPKNEYHRVLRHLEANPELWRDCALAFLEEQALEQELQSLMQSNVNLTSIEKPIAAETIEPASKLTAEQVQKRARLEWMHKFTSIAALLLISFTIGWFGSGLRNTLGTSGRTGGGEDLVAGTDQASDPQRPLDTNPKVDGEHLQYAGEGMVPFEAPVPKVLRELERRGSVNLESSNSLVPVQLEDGSVILVPVHQIDVKPRVFPY